MNSVCRSLPIGDFLAETSHTLLDTNSIREDCDQDFDQDFVQDLDQDPAEDRDKDLNQDEFDNDNDDDYYYGNEDKDGYINHSYHNRMKSLCPVLQKQQKYI